MPRFSIDQTILIRFEEVFVRCTICDLKPAYGRMLLDVKPTDGAGRQWVSESRIHGLPRDTA